MRLATRLVLSIAAFGCAGAAIVSGCGGFAADDVTPDAAAADSPVVLDEAASPDAAAEAAPGVDAAFACPPGAFLCDDFERTTLLGDWGGFVGDNDAAAEASTLALDTQFASSPTHSLKAGPRTATQAALTKQLSSVSRIEISFSLRTEAPSAAQVMVISVQFETNAGFVHLALKDGGLVLIEQLRPTDGGTEFFLPENVTTAPQGVFQRYTFIVDYTMKKYSLKHGSTVTQKDLVLPQLPMTLLSIGTVFTSLDSTPHWIDDVVVVTKP